MGNPPPTPGPTPVPVPTPVPQKVPPPVPPDPEPGASPQDTAPYDRTPQNTSPDWLPPEWANTKPDLIVHLDGMTDYAKKMKTLSDQVGDKLGHFTDMIDLASKAWTPGAIPEGVKFYQLANHNFSEVMQYMYNLKSGVENTAMAAQAVADYYGDTDGWSSAALAGVNFAFGDTNVAAPANWAHGNKTWLDYQKDSGNPSGQVQPPDIWVDGPKVVSKDGLTITYTSTNQRGETRTVTIRLSDIGSIMVINGPEGTTTTAIETQPDGTIIKSSTMESKPQDDGTVIKSSSHQTITTSTANGVTTITTTSYNGDNKKTSEVIDVLHKNSKGHVTAEEIKTVTYNVKTGNVSDTETLYLGEHTDVGDPGDIQTAADHAIDVNNYRPQPDPTYQYYTPY
jgi:hypothetical protein